MGAAGESRCQICIAGGGPAGMMLGLLLARSGIRVKVLEKHADFFRDFRGDTIHPSTLEILDELGMLDEFLKLPHQEVRQLRGQIGDTTLTLADFTHLPVRCKFLAFMPQWDFLNFLAERARAYAGFQLEMESEVTGLTFDGERVTGVRVRTPAGVREVSADLVVGTDGREATASATCATGTTSSSSPCRSIVCGGGIVTECSASETPRTRCHPSPGSESTWRSRTRSRRPTYWSLPCGIAARLPTRRSPRFRSAGSCRRRSRSALSC